jgi:tetratricopeptide (TPR) repeat protein
MADLIPIAEPAERKLNVVFVHGLGGDAWKTWALDGKEENFWPSHLAGAVSGLGVFSLDYDASPSTWLGKAMSIPDRAGNVLSRLVAAPQLRSAPIVFICHSLGGLVVKQALLDADEQTKAGKRHREFLENVRGVAFLATPHTGSDLATLLKAIGFVARTSPVAEDLSRNNGHIRKLRQRYQTWAHEFGMRHLVFIEKWKIRDLAMVVEEDSADPVFPNAWATPIDADHFGICKPKNENDDVHVGVVAFLEEIIEAPARLSRADRAALARLEAEIAVAREEGVDPKLLEPIFVELGHEGLSPGEMRQRAKEAIAAIIARSKERVARSNEGADIDATIAAARAQLRQVDTRGALALLDAKIAEEQEARRRRMLPLLRERTEIARLALDYATAKASLTEMVRVEPDDGWAWVELGDLERISGTVGAAEAAFRAALRADRAKGDEVRIAVALDRIGDVLVARNDLEGALKHYREGLEISRALYEQDKSHAERARDVSVSLDRIGDVLVARNDLEGALKHYREGLEIRRALYEQDKSHAERARDVSVSLDRIGDVLVARNDLAGALNHYREGLDISRALYEQDKSHGERARDVSVSVNKIGDVLVARNDLEGALKHYRECLEIRRALYEQDKSHGERARDVAISNERLGDIALAREDTVGARKHFSESLEIWTSLARKDPSNLSLARGRAVPIARLGEIEAGEGNVTKACAYYREGAEILESLVGAAPDIHEYAGFLEFFRTRMKEAGC